MRRRSKSISLLASAIAVLVMWAGPAADLQAEDIKGQRPMMFIGDIFQFVPGTWAGYLIQDRAKNDYYRMYFAVLERVQVDNVPCSWMEMEIVNEKTAPVVTRFLVEETKEGPGNIREVIVQMKGYRPFTVPKKYFEGTDKEVGQFTPSFIQKRVAQRIMNLAGTNIPAWEAEATDSKGKRTRALVSENILPLGVIMAETAEVGMYLSEWGQGAGTKITGTPVNFYLWIMMQVGEGMTK